MMTTTLDSASSVITAQTLRFSQMHEPRKALTPKSLICTLVCFYEASCPIYVYTTPHCYDLQEH